MNTYKRTILQLIGLSSLTGCTIATSPKPAASESIPITFEVYDMPESMSSSDVPYDRSTIPLLLRSRRVLVKSLDAAKGLPTMEVWMSDRDLRPHVDRVPPNHRSRDTHALSKLVPESWRRIGGLRFYYVGFDDQGRIRKVVAEKSGSIFGNRDLFALCHPGDKIVAEFFF